MAPNFGRSISFPVSPSRSLKAARHVRSVSLPCSSHPLLAHLQSQIGAVRAWIQDPASVSAGFAHLDALHAALGELLLLPEARSALQNGSAASSLLDGFLILADAHGAFQETALELKAHCSEAQAALRRSDAARLASAVRAQCRAEKDVARLAASVRGAAKLQTLISNASNSAEVEVSAVLVEAVAAVAAASTAVFSAVEAMSAAATTLAASTSMKSSLVSLVTRTSKTSDDEKEILAFQRLMKVEECIAEIEIASDKVFRSILHTRVALLNMQTC